MGFNNDDVLGLILWWMLFFESIDSRVDVVFLFLQSKRYGVIDYVFYNSEYGQYQFNRRVKLVFRFRVNWDIGIIKENGKIVQVLYGIFWYCFIVVFFEEIVQVERVYICNFVEVFIKYEEDCFLKDDFKFEFKSDLLCDVIVW